MVAFLGREYPKRIWTKFESEQFKKRFGENSIVPIWFADAPPGMFDETARVGGVTIDRAAGIDGQVAGIAELLLKKIADIRTNPPV